MKELWRRIKKLWHILMTGCDVEDTIDDIWHGKDR